MHACLCGPPCIHIFMYALYVHPYFCSIVSKVLSATREISLTKLLERGRAVQFKRNFENPKDLCYFLGNIEQ